MNARCHLENKLRKIKLYPNRRLYDPALRRYITFDRIYRLLREGHPLKIQSVDRGIDVTPRILMQLVLNQELELPLGDEPSLTDDFLREIIRVGASGLAPLVAPFLDHSLELLCQAVPERAPKTAKS